MNYFKLFRATVKIALSTVLFSFNSTSILAQNIDSFLAIPQTLELATSTPQPRMDEKFQVYLDMNHVRAQIFKSVTGKIKFVGEMVDDNKIVVDLKAIGKGKCEIGPLAFTINGTRYTTNKITYDVIDALPEVDNGLWFRAVKTRDSILYVIVEQRIPAKVKETVYSDSSITWGTEATHHDLVGLKTGYSIPGVSDMGSRSNTEYGTIYDNSGAERSRYLSRCSVYHFRISDPSKSIRITKGNFDNLPKGYLFKDIVVK